MTCERSPLLAHAHASPPHEEQRPASPPSPARPMGTPLFPFHPRARSTPFWRKLMLMLFDGHRHVTMLRESDVWPLEPQFEGARAAEDLRRHIPEHGRWRLVRGVCNVNRHRLLSAAALRLVGIALNVTRPLLLYRWLCTTDEMGYRYELASLVGVALLSYASALVMCHSREIDMRVHWQAFSALYAMITDRIVNVGSLATTGSAMDTPSASVGYKQRLTQITKTLVNDLEAIGESLLAITGVWAGMIKLVVSIIVLTWVVHIPPVALWSAIAAYAVVFVVSFAVGEPLAGRAESAFVFRLNTVHECLKGIQMVKLNAWEDKMEAKIQQARDNERRAANRLHAVMLVTRQLIEESPMLFAAVAFSSSVWEPTAVPSGASTDSRPFTPTRAFVALVLFGDCLHYARFMKYAFETLLVGIGAWQRVESLLLGDSSSQRSAVASPNSPPSPPSANVVVEMSGVCLSSPQTSSSSAPTLLINVNWKVYQGELVVVHGAAGLGKSMLLGAIRDDLSVVQLLQGSARPVPPDCRIAYCSQDPWLQAVSIRENILFGTEFDKQKYWAVIDACELLEDLSKLPEGDATAVGPRGINLSSGQCARIALARACYADADLYLLDCPLANVDPVVQSEIFRKCIVELLMFKTVVIVTHNPEYIGSTYVDQLVHVQPLSVRVTNRSSKRKLQESNAPTVSRRLRDYQRSIPQRGHDDRSLSLVQLSRDAMGFVDQVTSSRKTASSNAGSENKGHLLLFTRGLQHLFQAHRGYALLSLIFVLLLGAAFCARDVWIMKWAAESSFVTPASGTQAAKSESAMLVYVYLVVAAVVLGLAARGCIALLTSQHAGQLFSTMTHAVLHSSMTLFYHTPIGETINRYYSDMMAVDELLPQLLSLFALSVVSFASRVLIVGWVLGPVGTVLFVVGYAVATQTLSNAFCVETTLLLLNTRAKLLSLVSEVVDGEAVIRAFGSQRTLHVFRTLDRVGDTFKRTAMFISVFNNSVILTSELMTTALILSLLALVASRHLTPAEHGLILLNIFMLQNEIIGHFSTGLVNTVISFSCADRLREYGNLETEVDVDSSTKLLVPTSRAAWPQQGGVVFESVDFSYTGDARDSKAAALALRNVSFSIRGGEKIGVIGRTGSGKSSLAMALLRVHPLRSGHVSIDGMDLRTVPLTQLRRSVTMIPQSPTFYRCSVRDYLDPFHEFDDARLWRELLTVELGARVQSLEEELLDNGENWSLGQRQLLCFARALLKPSRVVVLDEAFSCVDQACQEKILRVLRDRFASSTVVLITHRLDQILEFDRILVMRGGRVVESGSASELASDAGSVFYEFLETSLLTF